MHRYSARLSTVDRGFVGYLPLAARTHLAKLGVPVRFGRRQILFCQGESGRDVYVLMAGGVKVVRCEPDGGATMLTVRCAGDVVGDMAALDAQPRSATVTALTPLMASWLPAERFREFVSAASGAAAGFARYTLARLRESDEQRTALAVLPVRQRLARSLISLAHHTGGDPNVVDIGLTQQDLAQFVGASRNAVVAELTWLREMRIVVTRRCKVIFQDVAALERLADTGTSAG